VGVYSPIIGIFCECQIGLGRIVMPKIGLFEKEVKLGGNFALKYEETSLNAFMHKK